MLIILLQIMLCCTLKVTLVNITLENICYIVYECINIFVLK